MQFRVRITTSYRGTSERTVDAETKMAAMENALKDWADIEKAELYGRRESDGRLSYGAKATGSLFPGGRNYADVHASIV